MCLPVTPSRLRSGLVDHLRERIRGIETISLRATDRAVIATGFAELDRLLADGGLRAGSLVEWTSESLAGGGAMLAFTVAGHILKERGTVAIIDEEHDFYPAGAVQLGWPLDRCLVIRPDTDKLALWAWEQALRCPRIALTIGKKRKHNDRAWKRLQSATEVGNGLGFVLSSSPDAGTPWATTRIHVQAVPQAAAIEASGSPARRLRVSVPRGEAGHRQRSILLELDYARLVSAFSELADPAPRRRDAG